MGCISNFISYIPVKFFTTKTHGMIFSPFSFFLVQRFKPRGVSIKSIMLLPSFSMVIFTNKKVSDEIK